MAIQAITPGIRVVHSNRVEVLSQQLLDRLFSHPLSDPLTPDFVLVDNKVLGDWLNLQMALQQGVAANTHYVQPHQLFWKLARAVVEGDIPKDTPLSKEEMVWKLYALLGSEPVLAQDVMLPVRNYLQGEDCRDLKRYQLAAAVADLFDQYLIYRPEMMRDWESLNARVSETAGTHHWQCELWKRLTKHGQAPHVHGLHHRAAIEQRLFETLDTAVSDTLRRLIPMQRLSVFGITSMPPRLLDMLMLLGRHIPVDLYVMNPCREYWFDIKPARTLVKKPGKREVGVGVIGNPLLASQGQQVREFIESLYARLDQFPFEEAECYSEPGNRSLLHCIQQEILDLQYQGGMSALTALPEGDHKQTVPAAEQDKAVRSVQIHSCHSPLREVEVLHDQLLALFQQDATLKPRDIVVMMPQVAPYVPYIETVFGETSHVLPYHITDRSLLEEVPLLTVLDVLLGLPGSRLPLTEILALLEVPAVQSRFNMDRAGFEKLKGWLRDAGARWGLDAAHREQEGLPAYSEFSWEFAINRLLAGYGMATDSGDMPLELGGDSLAVMPYDEVEGGAANLLDSFLQCWEKLKFWRQLLAEPATADVWADRITSLLDDFMVPQTDDETLALREIRRQVNVLRKASQWFTGTLDLSVVKAVVQPALQAPAQGGHPWREGIRFCSLMPMRGVPFRVVYMLGMNQNDYPKRNVQSGFDLMRQAHKPGDRSRRVDDRWLFLEALLSARDVFHVSYIGRDQRKNEVRQPSVVLAELMDYLRHGYCLPGVEDASGNLMLQNLTLEHPLQPFSKAYFVEDGNRRLLSFNKQAFVVATHKQVSIDGAVTNDAWLQSAPADKPVEVSLDSFVRFFTRPAQWFFRDRHWKVSLKIEDDAVSDSEMFELAAGLEGWALKDALYQLANSMEPEGDPEQRVESVFDVLEERRKAEGSWPLGAGGDKLRAKITSELDVSWLDARRAMSGAPVSYSGQHTFETPFGTLLLRGEVACIGDAFFYHTASKHGYKHTLQFYIRSAFSGLSMPAVKRALAVFWGNKRVQLEDLSQREHAPFLSQLASLYMQYREHGLPFEPGLSLSYKPEYAQDADKWKSAVQKVWHGDSFNSDGLAGDIQAMAYYMSEQRLLDESFSNVAERLIASVDEWMASEQATEVQS